MIYIDLKDDLSEKMVYDYPDCPAYTIHEMLSHYPNYSAISHWHDDIEFLMIQSGQMQYNVNGKILNTTGAEAVKRSSNTLNNTVWVPPPEPPFVPIRLVSMSLREASM